jgi:type IV secretory pathway component VirB8
MRVRKRQTIARSIESMYINLQHIQSSHGSQQNFSRFYDPRSSISLITEVILYDYVTGADLYCNSKL